MDDIYFIMIDFLTFNDNEIHTTIPSSVSTVEFDESALALELFHQAYW